MDRDRTMAGLRGDASGAYGSFRGRRRSTSPGRVRPHASPRRLGSSRASALVGGTPSRPRALARRLRPPVPAVLERDGRPEGYALYRVEHSWRGVSRWDLHPGADGDRSGGEWRDIWQFVFGIDLVARVKAPGGGRRSALPARARAGEATLPARGWALGHILDEPRSSSPLLRAGSRSRSARRRLLLLERGPVPGPTRERRPSPDSHPGISLSATELATVYLGGLHVRQLERAVGSRRSRTARSHGPTRVPHRSRTLVPGLDVI